MDKSLISSAAFSSQGGTDDPVVTKVDNVTRKDWNDYIIWLEKKGLKGHPSLDHNNLGLQMIDQYRKEHPETTISKDMVIPIQKEFSNYRNYAIKKIEQNKGAYAPGTNKDNFLRALSIVDGIPGQRTTSFIFPEEYMTTFTKTFENKKLVKSESKTEDKGFATMK